MTEPHKLNPKKNASPDDPCYAHRVSISNKTGRLMFLDHPGGWEAVRHELNLAEIGDLVKKDLPGCAQAVLNAKNRKQARKIRDAREKTREGCPERPTVSPHERLARHRDLLRAWTLAQSWLAGNPGDSAYVDLYWGAWRDLESNGIPALVAKLLPPKEGMIA